jgi:hypothetical protein
VRKGRHDLSAAQAEAPRWHRDGLGQIARQVNQLAREKWRKVATSANGRLMILRPPVLEIVHARAGPSPYILRDKAIRRQFRKSHHLM